MSTLVRNFPHFFLNILFSGVFLLIPASAKPNGLGPDIVYPQWLASAPSTNCSGPIDNAGKYWYEPDFDDSTWNVITLPIINDIPPNMDRFYRTTFIPPASSSIMLNLASDDGIWVYINGQPLGHWGGGCYQIGCVGDVPYYCSIKEDWLMMDISPYLIVGQPNFIAVHVTNEPSFGSASYFSLDIIPNRLSFDLPIQYQGRTGSDQQGFYKQANLQLLSLFDHSPANDGIHLPFVGSPFDNLNGMGNCKPGVNCYDGNLAWGFKALANPEPVFAVADGYVVPEKTGCFANDGYGCRVCIKHGNGGYSTLYYHLDSGSLVTSGQVTKDNQIGVMGVTTGNTQSRLGFSTFYDVNSSCQPGKEVDPGGWAAPFEVDPREKEQDLKSLPLWTHTMSSQIVVPTNAPAELVWGDMSTKVTFPAGTYMESLDVTLAPSPGPYKKYPVAGIGKTFYLNAVDQLGKQVNRSNQPIQIQIAITPDDLNVFWPGSLNIYQYDSIGGDWVSLPTSRETLAFTAETQNITPFALLGQRILYLVSNVVGNGSISVSPPGPYRFGEVLEVTATPAAGWYFTGWSGDLIGCENPASIVVEDDLMITANFTQNEVYTVNLDISGNGQVDVNKTGPYTPCDSIQLTATADYDWYFVGWNGDLTGNENPIKVDITSDKNILATFYQFGSITITKQAFSPLNTIFDFDGDLGPFNLQSSNSLTFNDLVSSDYDVIEDLLSNWRLVDASCVGGDYDPITNGVTIHLDSGEDITCTYINEFINKIFLPTIFYN